MCGHPAVPKMRIILRRFAFETLPKGMGGEQRRGGEEGGEGERERDRGRDRGRWEEVGRGEGEEEREAGREEWMVCWQTTVPTR